MINKKYKMAAKMYIDYIHKETSVTFVFSVSSSDSPNSFTLALSTGYNLHKTLCIKLIVHTIYQYNLTQN